MKWLPESLSLPRSRDRLSPIESLTGTTSAMSRYIMCIVLLISIPPFPAFLGHANAVGPAHRESITCVPRHRGPVWSPASSLLSGDRVRSEGEI